MFAHYGIALSQASKQVDSLKMLLETAEATVYRKLRDQANEDKEKVTEAQLDKSVARHPRVLSIKKALNEAKQIEANAKTAVEAFRHRRDMLIQQGLLAREEMKGEVVIAERNARQDVEAGQRSRLLDSMRTKREEIV